MTAEPRTCCRCGRPALTLVAGPKVEEFRAPGTVGPLYLCSRCNGRLWAEVAEEANAANHWRAAETQYDCYKAREEL